MKLGYSKTFPNVSNGEWEKVWVEEEFEGTLEQARTRWYAQKKEVENFHYESKAHDAKVAAETPIQQKEEPQSTEAKIIAQIYGCSDLKVLESFKLLSQNNKAVKAAYEQQFEKLSKKV